MTTIDALILLGLSTLFGSSDPNLADALVKAFAVLFGFGAIGIINLVLFAMAVLSIITQSRAVSSVLGIAMLGKMLKK